MRGNQQQRRPEQHNHRSIPAYAGEPRPGCQRAKGSRVYPRVCGGTGNGVSSENRWQGLSPRMRGNRIKNLTPHIVNRSIPAYAGEPTGMIRRRRTRRVYPRVCGGTAAAAEIVAMPGLSPRMRGNPHSGGQGVGVLGSIPAYAGEPRRRSDSCRAAKVYPRVCGGTL